MSEARTNGLGKILAFAAVVEVGTGLALIAAPAIVVALLLGANGPGPGMTLGRFLGIALLALGLACWPGGQRVEHDPKTFQGMLTYNLLVALFLAYLGTVEHLGGPLLWPAVVLHAVVAVLLIWTWHTGGRAKAANH
jgi:Ca2+/Na+ antiporter